MNIRILSPNDIEEFLELLSVFEIAFEMESFQLPENSHINGLLENEGFKVIVAMKENKVMGGLTMYILDQYYSEKKLAYLYDLAVLPDHQRKGVGKKLIGFMIDYCRQKGYEEVFVHAEKEDEHAIDFYRSTGPASETNVLQFTYSPPQK